MSDERPGLPWLMEAGYGPESRVAALAARKAKHPDWNWGRFQKGGTTVHVHPGAPDHRIVREPSIPLGQRGAFRVEQRDMNSSTGYRTVHSAEGLPAAEAHVERQVGIVSAEEMKRRRTHAATMNRLAGTHGVPDRGPTRPVGGINW